MFPREFFSKLEYWADSDNRKPLVLRGARQVGKTVTVKMFGERFERFIYLNLDLPRESEIFRRRLPVRETFQAILIKTPLPRDAGRTLLFIDEIQNCPEAVESLRYFYEDLPEIHVVAAGSLLEIALHERHISFPVGRVEQHFLYPLTFREFLIALGAHDAVRALDSIPLPAYAYQALMEYFHRYVLIGGMPEVVATYIKKKDVTALNDIYSSLLVSYQDDAEKYARNATMATILRHCIETAPFAAGQRITFAGFGQSNYRSREIGEALHTLQRAMLINLLYPSTSVEIPIMPDLKKAPRLQLLDTGLLNYFAGLQELFFYHDNLHGFYKGVLAEHIVGQELIAAEPNTRKKQCFWVRGKSNAQAEVDFLIQHRDHVVPVEVKSGKTGRLRSLFLFMDRCPHHFAIRMYAGPLEIQRVNTLTGKKFYLLNLPYFLSPAVHEYLEWMMEEIK
jgi:predicted AAA+ superfamily ATPase